MTTLDDLVTRTQTELRRARLARDEAATVAARTLLAALSNAEAPDLDGIPTEVRGQLVEHERRVLTPADVAAVVADELARRHETIAVYVEHGRDDAADALRAEVAVIERLAG